MNRRECLFSAGAVTLVAGCRTSAPLASGVRCGKPGLDKAKKGAK